MEKVFKLKENNTNVRTEILAGLTTFMTMAYIIALNPNLITGFAVGTPLWNGVFLATCLASGIGTICMAFLANKPFAMAPGMGLNSFFATVCGNILAIMEAKNAEFTYTNAFQAAVCIILVEGIVFIVLSVLSIREKIVDAIPMGVRVAIAPGIGLMLLNIGFGSNVGVYDDNGNANYVFGTFFAALNPKVVRDSMGSAYPTMVLTVITIFLGVFCMVILKHFNVRANVLLGMVFASVVYWIGSFALGTNPFASLSNASWLPPFSDMAATTLFKFDFKTLFVDVGWFTAITLIITFCMIDMFDTIGTLVGTASRAGMIDEKGNMPKMKEALLSDAIGTTVGAVTGTSTVTTFIESAAGVEAGGRTGLTALTTGVLFLACIFLSPIAAIIPAAATSSALVYVGILMLSGLKKLDFDDFAQLAPAAIMLIGMPITGSIGHAIGLALITYTVIKLCTGKAKEVSWLTIVISAIFLLKFFIVA